MIFRTPAIALQPSMLHLRTKWPTARAMLYSALPHAGRSRLGKRESVVLLASLMALNAFAIDMMLPALPAIAHGLGVTRPNDQQYIIIAYTLGLGVGQMAWGPLADRFGRRPLLIAGLSLYALLAVGCALAPTFGLLLAGRAAMGAAAASTRVLVTAIVRDLFEGEAMAQVMSLVFMTFLVVPVIAPSIGQAVLTIAPWSTIFYLLAGYAAFVLAWTVARLPETLHPGDRRSIMPSAVLEASRVVTGDRLSVGYTLATTALFGALSAYIASIQQITADAFHAPERVPLVFAACAAPMAGAAFANSRIVGRFGLRQVGHAGLAGFVIASTAHWAVAMSGHETLLLFVVFQAIAFVSFAFCSSNFSTLAMTHMESVAGTASSIQGVTSSIGGALIGLVIGQLFDLTVLPFLTGMMLCGLGAAAITFATERGKLFEALSVAEQA